jgi:hypothetical protein
LKKPDENTVPLMDLSIETLTRVCKGDVSKLPQFVVHRNRHWKKNTARLDKKNRIHMNVRTFLRQVKSQLPVRPGIWLGPNEQMFRLDLQPHHLQGGEDTVNQEHTYKQSREIAGADEHGRFEDDPGFQTDLPEPNGAERPPVDLGEPTADGQRRGVRSTALDPGDSEDG